jgi:thiol:disulfide interchange protein
MHPTLRRRGAAIALTLAVLALIPLRPAHAQLRGVKANVTPLVERAAHPGDTVRMALTVTLPEGMHVQSNAPRDPSLIPTALTINPPSGATIKEVVYPPATDLRQTGIPQPLAVFERTFSLGVLVALDTRVHAGALPIPAALRYQACNDRMCFAPATTSFTWTIQVVPGTQAISSGRDPLFDRIAFGRGQSATSSVPARVGSAVREPTSSAGRLDRLDAFALAATTGGYLRTDAFLQFVHDAERGVARRGWFEGRGPLAIVLLVLLGGIALNLTPCVLPMIPINLAIIGAGAAAASRGRGFWLGAAYGSAMALVYGVLGLMVILTAGTFGTINASPWFNLAIAVLFVALALAMFDVLTIDFSGLAGRVNPAASRGTMLLAFSMGAVAALLAGACVAPVVIEVVLFSTHLYTAGTTIALGLPFILGMGMALPWPIAGASLAALPKPGAWMVRVKQVFGVAILLTAVYYGYEAYQLFANRWVDPSAVETSVAEQLKEGWHASLDEGLVLAEREHKPVLLDFWATWCKNCLTMDRTTLADTDVKRALDGYVKVKVQAEDPDQDPAKTLMARFRAVGLPTYVILQPKPAADRSPAPSAP